MGRSFESKQKTLEIFAGIKSSLIK